MTMIPIAKGDDLVRLAMTKSYDQQAVDQMRADLRVLDAEVLELESFKRVTEARIRLFDQDFYRDDLRDVKAGLKSVQRKQRSLAAKVWRIEAAKEKRR